MKKFIESTWRSDPRFRALCNALRSCKNEEEIADFLRDIGTLSELQAWSERWDAAKQLARGLSYRQVAKNTGASTTTITRVARFLENGTGGYRRALKVERKEIERSPVEQLIDRLPSKQHQHTNEQHGERQASMLQKYLNK